MEFTPPKITKLLPNEVFVFGSNWAGRHGRGAAKQAVKFGAKNGKGTGMMGQSYGIATKDHSLRVLGLHHIRVGVERFIHVARSNPHRRFLVTPIGCGLARYKPKDIAPMFFSTDVPPNVILPESFYRALDLI